GVLAFLLALAYRTYQTVGSDDLDDMQSTDLLTSPADEVEPDLVATDRRGDPSPATPAIGN
ncbi:MAG TPA: hypothetical protein VFV93_18885, partial [Thermomicrobiales bacterium]|nr:hypothetical protein [Thermomicrobiales bacterium]